MRLLIVEDESGLAGALRIGLEREGYAVDLAGSCAQAREKLAVWSYDVLLLDINLPDGDGFTRREVRAASSSVVEVADVTLDTARQLAHRAGRELSLTRKEFALLRYLMSKPGHLVPAEELLEHVWDENVDPFTQTVRVTMGTLRRKLSAEGEPQLLETVVGRGYRLREEPPAGVAG